MTNAHAAPDTTATSVITGIPATFVVAHFGPCAWRSRRSQGASAAATETMMNAPPITAMMLSR